MYGDDLLTLILKDYDKPDETLWNYLNITTIGYYKKNKSNNIFLEYISFIEENPSFSNLEKLILM